MQSFRIFTLLLVQKGYVYAVSKGIGNIVTIPAYPYCILEVSVGQFDVWYQHWIHVQLNHKFLKLSSKDILLLLAFDLLLNFSIL